MGALLNGSATRGRKEPNGYVDSSIERRSRMKNKRSRAGFLLAPISVAARLAIWYCIITSLFFCPQEISKLDAESPAVCKPYLRTRAYLEPHARPYYDAYVDPYVKQAEPYIEKLNANVYTPVSTVSRKYYDAYAGPHVNKVYQYLDDEWEKSAVPYLKSLQGQAQAVFDKNVGPYAKTATDNIAPYYQSADESVRNAYQKQVLPVYNLALPYAQEAYTQGHHVTTKTIFPNVLWAVAETNTFLSRQLWPKIRVLYGENVEPQLVRISERLGRYKDGKKLEAAVDAVASSAQNTVPPSAASSIAASVSDTPYPSSAVSQQSSTTPAAPVESADERSDEEKASERVAADLKTWQEKFAKAADKGAEDLGERVKEITDRQIENQAQAVGESRIVQLEETVNSRIKSLKKAINSAADDLDEDSDEDDINAEHEKIVKDIRSAGMAIREKAQALRSWKVRYDEETHSLVKAALDSTLEVIDNIRDLGLQEIGMRWAWMEGVTYKDWSKYHALKKTFDAWRAEVEAVAMSHDGLAAAKKEGEAVEERGMAIAEDAAKELSRLKEVAQWKLHARDSSDDFSSRNLPAAALKAAQQVIEKVIPGASSAAPEDPLESLVSEEGAKASQKAKDLYEDASEAVVGHSQGTIESLASKAYSVASSIADSATGGKASSASSGSKKASSSANSVASSASSAASSASSAASSVVLVDAEGVGEKIAASASSAGSKVSSVVVGSKDTTERISSSASSVVSEASEAIFGADDPLSSASSAVSSVASAASGAAESIYSAPKFKGDQVPISIKGTPEPVAEKASASLSSAASAASEAVAQEASSAYSSIKRVPGGVAAGFVEAREGPILEGLVDDDDTALDKFSRFIATEASQRYAQATSMAAEQYDIAKRRLSEQMGSSKKPVYEEIMSSIENSYSGSLEVASKKYREALNIVRPTQGVLESVSSEASVALNRALSDASKQYTAMKIAVGVQPTPVHQQYLSAIQTNYYQAIGQAHQRYSDFITAASRTAFGTPTPAYESLLSEARGQYGSATSAASAFIEDLYRTAKSAAGAEPTQGNMLDAAYRQYESAVSAAESALSVASESASVAFYGTSTGRIESLASKVSADASSIASVASASVIGTETPWHASVAQEAAQNWRELVEQASRQVYGTPTPWYQAAVSSIGSYGAQATDGAAVQYSSVQALVSELVVGKKPKFQDSVYSRLSSAYATGLPAVASDVSSAVSEVYSSATSVASEGYASASSVVVSVMTPPATLEALFDSASEQVQGVVSDASVQLYGTEKGAFEKAASAAADAASTASQRASEAVWGTKAGYLEAAQSSLSSAASEAEAAVRSAFWPDKPSNYFDDAASAASKQFTSLLSAAQASRSAAGSQASIAYSDLSSSVSSAVYGSTAPYESATSRLQAAFSQASKSLAELAAGTSKGPVGQATDAAESVASSVKSAASSIAQKVKDEL